MKNLSRDVDGVVWTAGYVGVIQIDPLVGGHQQPLTLAISLKTNSEFTPENGWLEDDPFLLGWLPGRCELLVSVRVYPYANCCFANIN